jgi:CheY-like chemotaxis protein
MRSDGQEQGLPRVMIVDDEESIRATVQELFALEGIGVLAASSADDCLAQLRGGFSGVILMDVMMPERDGWAAIRDIKQAGLHKENIIVMLTALDAPDERMNGLQDLVIDYITKPFSPDDIISSVRTYLGYLEAATVPEG